MLPSNTPLVSRTSLALYTTLPSMAIPSRRVLAVKCTTKTQVRAFRFGIWSSYLDPECQKEPRHRHRVTKHKYTDSLNRMASWERHFAKSQRKFGIPLGVYREEDTRRPSERNVDNNSRANNEATESRRDPTKIGDESAWDQASSHIRRKGLFQVFLSQRRSLGPSWTMQMNESTLGETPNSTPININKTSKSSNSDPEYLIDPITNRRVYRNTTADTTPIQQKATDIPVRTFKGYRSQFEDLKPPSSSPFETASVEEAPVLSKKQDTARKAEEKDEQEDVISKVQESSSSNQIPDHLQKFEQANPYGKRRYREPESEAAVKSTGNKDGLGSYDEKVQFYRDGIAYDPSKCKIDYDDPAQKGLKPFDEKKAENCCQNARAASSPTELHLKAGDEHEPRNSTQSSDPVLISIQEYEATVSNPRAKAFHDAQINAQRAHLSAFELDYPTDPTREALKVHEDKAKANKYPFEEADIQAQASDASPKAVPNRIKRFFERRYSRGANDAYALSKERQEDLDLLRASDIRASSGILKHQPKETDTAKLAMRKELELAFEKHQEAETKKIDATTTKVNQVTVSANDLKAQDDGPSQPKAKEVEPEKKGMIGNFFRDFPEEFQATWVADGAGGLTCKTPTQKDADATVQNEEKRYVEGLASKDIFTREPKPPRIETSLDRSFARKEKTEPTPSQGTSEELLRNSISRLTKALAEEENSYDTIIASSVQQSEGAQPSGSTNQQEPPKLSKQAEFKDSDLVRKIRSIYEEAYGIINPDHRQVAEKAATPAQIPQSSAPQTIVVHDEIHSSTSELPEPTLYKILAYDPTMQSINIAETTSIVADSSAPLTPADVLLRLSNPAKFFPHFRPLQAEGYEIVSGSGDVLVFRKVRPSSKIDNSRLQTRELRNPIDGMRAIAPTGDFASPTGFVNHDINRGTEPAFKSNIDVRREEPVFSGKRNWQDENEFRGDGKGGRVKKVLVGAAWLAGCSYAIGVVADYFTTGGTDRQGPQGF